MKYWFTRKELNIRQMGWLELTKDYDCIIKYLARESNIVANALNRKEKLNVLTMFED